MHYKISVIIPVYNTEQYLEKCLQSIKQQTLQDIEIICIDDASTDQSLVILEKFQSGYKDCLLLKNSQNRGLSYSRNKAMQYARGEYIYFMDSDDYINNDALNICYQELKTHNLDIIFFELKAVYENNLKEKYEFNYRRNGVYNGCFSGKELFVVFDRNNDHKVNTPGAIFSKQYLKKIKAKFYDGIIYEDNIFYLQTLFMADRVKCLNVALYNRVVRNNSIVTKSYGRHNLISCVIGFAECLRFIMNTEAEIKYYQALSNYARRYKSLFSRIYNELKRKPKSLLQGVLFSDVYYMCMYDELRSQCKDVFYGIKEEYVDTIRQSEQLIIYGCGILGKRTIIALSDINVSHFILAVSEKSSDSRYLMGNEIHSIEDVKVTKKTVVLVAAGKKYEMEMVSNLCRLGYVNYILSSEFLESE